MTRVVKFYGASDDLFEIEGTRKGEPSEIDPSLAVKVSNDFAGLVVSAHYCPGVNGVWAIGISQIDEDEPLPDWPMKWSAKGYSTVLTIEVPDSVTLSTIGGD